VINNTDSNENPYNIRVSGTADGDAPDLTSFARQTPSTSTTNENTLFNAYLLEK